MSISLAVKKRLVLDTSVLINLNAFGSPELVLGALPFTFEVVDDVIRELKNGSGSERGDDQCALGLKKLGLLNVKQLDDESLNCFQSLVTGSSAGTLDDGEAATIAHAVKSNGIAVLDERKARRICMELFPALPLLCTCDLFMDSGVLASLGSERLKQGLLCALRKARMRILPEHMAWVVEIIGKNEAKMCNCLPASVRLTL